MTNVSNDSAGLDALLAAYSAGAMSPAMHALFAAHLMMSRQNAGFVASLESTLGDELAAHDPTPVRDRDQRLAAIFEHARAEAPTTSGPASPLPAPLQAFVGKDFSQIRWRSRLPGIREYRVTGEGEGEANLYWIKAGRKMPNHTHGGSEVTLVLRGGFRDASGHFSAGDIAIADARVDHQPIADADEDCLCFAVTDAPLRLTGPLGRIVERLFGHSH